MAAADFHILQISGENIFIRFAAHVHNCILWHFVKRFVLYNPTTCHTKYFVWEKSLACEKLFWWHVYGDWQQVRWSHLISKSDANYGESSTHQKEAWIAYMRFGKHNLQEVTTKTPNRVAQKHEDYWSLPRYTYLFSWTETGLIHLPRGMGRGGQRFWFKRNLKITE